jgi:hypothetical protein
MKPHIPAFILILILLWLPGQAQSYQPFKVPMQRQLWHENVDKQQKRLSKDHDLVKVSADESINVQVSDALLRQVDELQEQIELDSTLDNQGKIKYLRTLDFLIQNYIDRRGTKDFPAAIAPALVKAFEQCMDLDKKNQGFQSVINENSYGVGRILVDCMLYSKDNPGMEESRLVLFRKYCGLHPDEILTELRKKPDVYFADSLIRVAAYYDVKKVYDYAQARGPLSRLIGNHPDTLVKLINRMANSRSGQLYFPFLDNLVRGKITFDEIDSVKDNDLSYFRLMVKTRMEYALRLLPPVSDTANEMQALTDMMARKAKQFFVREINALHTVDDDNVRFRRLEGLTAEELYYISVLGEDEIYTSSYVRGVYPRIFKQMTNPRGDSLIMRVHGDYFRKFIKMAAGYNTLNHFLGTMDKKNAETLMQSFVIGLERTKKSGDDNLEDAVDVADSYSSIMDKDHDLANFILNEVKISYAKNLQANNKRGIVIYNLLNILFESADTSRKVNLSALLGIPSIYGQDYKSMADDSGRVIQQVFFYGDEDKDGQNSFVNFMGMFRGKSDWKIDERNADWVTINSAKGKPVWIYANRPKYGEDDPDEKAQDKLIEYLQAKNLKPTVVVHRGHSYHLASTLEKLSPAARIVVLGSCGGYNNLNEVLTICKDAHIISSKQVGTKTVNEPILQAINANLVAGKNIDWINMWKELSGRFTSGDAKEKFDDYIPPYKNLGAIFIKAYRKAMGED